MQASTETDLFDHPEAIQLCALPMRMDCFENSCYTFDTFPLTKTYINDFLSKTGMQLSQSTSRDCCVSHGVNMFSVQGHDASVDHHTDDVHANDRFGVMPIWFKNPEAGSLLYRFDRRPVLNFFDGRKKVSKRMNLGEVLVFPPSKEHSLIFYGNSVKYLIFDVEKIV